MGKLSQKVIVMAVAAVPLTFGASAFGQYMTGNDGRALDASNQIGSGGYNQSVSRTPSVTPDDIIYGNVTGGRQFRGGVNMFDSREFRGTTSTRSTDDFIRDSSGAPIPGTAGVDLTKPQPFYGDYRAVAPPANSAQVGATGAFVGTSGPQRLDHSISGLQPGTLNYASPNALILPNGTQGAAQNQSVLTGSPLYGVRELSATDPYLSNLNRQPAAGDSSFMTPEQRLRSIQDELQNLAAGSAAANTVAGQQSLGSAMQKPFESPENAPLTPIQSQQQQNLLQGSAISGDLGTGESRGNRLLLPTAAQQSTQYAELERRLQRYQQQTETATDANARAYREQQQQQAKAAEQPAGSKFPAVNPNQPPAQRSGTNAGGTTPSAGAPLVVPPTGQVPAVAPAPREAAIPTNLPKPSQAPLQVKSLADGIQAQGLKNIMQQAEQAMQSGRFTDALMLYEQAEQAAPNNPLIELGKINALLGSTSFARAYPMLRNVLASDPALLLAQYDLKSMLGANNLQRTVKELKFVADVEKASPEAVFLLAYVSYNSNDEAMAARYLAEANVRSSGRDKFIQLLQQYWTLPAAQGDQPSDANK